MARTYQLPQVLVQQDFKSIPSAAVQQMLTCIIGPQRRVLNIGDIDEDNYVYYGDYSPEAASEVPIKALLSTDDLIKESVKVTLKEVWAKYAEVAGIGINQMKAADYVHGTTVKFNKITLGSGITGGFKNYLSNYRSSLFQNRDVKVGDRLKIQYGADAAQVVETRIVNLINDVTTPTLSVATAADSNPDINTTESLSGTGTSNFSADHLKVAIGGSSVYVGDLSSGKISESITLEVLTASNVATNLKATAKWTSSLGDTGNIELPLDSASDFDIVRGLRVKFTEDGTLFTDHTLGTKYVFTATDVYTTATTAPLPVVDADTDEDFLGIVETIYEVKVVKGGLWSSSPQVLVTTHNGIDSYPVQSVTGNSVSLYLGRLGVKFSFGGVGTGLRYGDVWNITAAPSTLGAVRTAQIADAIVVPVGFDTDGYLPKVEFYIYKDSVSIPATGSPEIGDISWSIDEEGRKISFKSQIEITDPTWVNGLGKELGLPVYRGKKYVEYTALVKGNSNRVIELDALTQIEPLIGEIVPENPLAYAAFKALENSGDSQVFVVPVETDDMEGYIQALSLSETDSRIYYIVPLTQDLTIIQLVKAHVLKNSEPENALERTCIVNQVLVPVDALYEKKLNTDEYWSGHVELMSTTTKPTLMIVPGATFLTDGIRVGDEVRSLYALDNAGNTVYQTAKVYNVIDEEQIELAGNGFGEVVGSEDVPKKIQIFRNLTKDEQAKKVSNMSSALSSRRVVNIWPDYIEDGAKAVDGVFAAAAIAGLNSSIAPHQPLTNVTVNGFTGVSRSTPFFTPGQLNIIAGGGTWIITKAPHNYSAQEGAIITRHQLTTDYTDTNMSEFTITKNLDSIAKWLRDDLKILIGRYNNHPYSLDLIRVRLEYRLTYLKGYAKTEQAGPQVIDYKIIKLEKDPLIRTTVNAEVELELPYPINNIKLKLVVV